MSCLFPSLILLHQGRGHLPCSKLPFWSQGRGLPEGWFSEERLSWRRDSVPPTFCVLCHQVLFSSVFPSLPVAADILVKVLVTFHIPHQALVCLTLSLQNQAVSLYSSCSPKKPKSALPKDRESFLLAPELYHLMITAAMAAPTFISLICSSFFKSGRSSKVSPLTNSSVIYISKLPSVHSKKFSLNS